MKKNKGKKGDLLDVCVCVCVFLQKCFLRINWHSWLEHGAKEQNQRQDHLPRMSLIRKWHSRHPWPLLFPCHFLSLRSSIFTSRPELFKPTDLCKYDCSIMGTHAPFTKSPLIFCGPAKCHLLCSCMFWFFQVDSVKSSSIKWEGTLELLSQQLSPVPPL